MTGFEYYEDDVHISGRSSIAFDKAFEMNEAPQTPVKAREHNWSYTKTYASRLCQRIGRSSPGYVIRGAGRAGCESS